MMCSRFFRAGAGQRPLRASSSTGASSGCTSTLPAHAAQPARHLAGADRDGRAAARRHALICSRCRNPNSRREEDQGIVARADHRPAQRDAGADADLRGPGVRDRASASPNTTRCSRSPACRRSTQGIGGVLFKPWGERTRSAQEIPAGPADEVEPDRRRARRRVPVPAAARLAAACRCSSSSRPPSRSPA